MTDFLASFNLGAQAPAASNDSQCDSIEQLQHQLRAVLRLKVTPNRAEHISTTLELKATVQFTLALSRTENGALEDLDNLDPSLGGAQPTGLPTGQAGEHSSRVVLANETLINQPHSDPALQRTVAKHIISVIGATDGSTWIAREVSRGSQGWTFTYLCKASFRQWKQQTSNNPTNTIVGEFSLRDPDPVLHSECNL